MPHVLVVDDDGNAREGLAELVGREGFSVSTAGSLAEARRAVAVQRPDVVLLDLMLPDGSGMGLFEDLDPAGGTEIVLITGHASVETSVQALRLHAADYLVKPVNVQQLKAILSRVARPADLRREIDTLRHELRSLGHFGRLLGGSPAMQQLYDQVCRVAPTAATVLIVGESGTGKEVVAQTLHELSRRRKQAFLAVNCGAISPQLIESELFGHSRGSFTGAVKDHKGYFERAAGGTLFLDEITEMPMELQVKLLRVLESGVFLPVGADGEVQADVRVIAATNREPEEAVASGRLRQDLLYRLQVFPLRLPPLRARGGDVELLARHFLAGENEAEHTAKFFTADALAQLRRYHWPGNVRELRNMVQRAFIMANEAIDAACLPPELGRPVRPSGPVFTVSVGSTVADVERSLILATLEQCGGARERAAHLLGISNKTLYNRLREYRGEAGPEPGGAEPAEPEPGGAEPSGKESSGGEALSGEGGA